MRTLLLLPALALALSLPAQILFPDEGCSIRYQHDVTGNRIQRDWYCWGNEVKNRGAEEDTVPDRSKARLSVVHMIVYPNPASDVLTVSFTDLIPAGTLAILDASGRTVHSMWINGTTAVLEVSGIAPGSYWLAFTSGSERIISGLAIAKESGKP